MNFFRRSELTPEMIGLLARYDETVRKFVGSDYRYPIRRRDWELARILQAVRSLPKGSSILDTGSFNTYLPLVLSEAGYQLTASDLILRRVAKSIGRRVGLLPPKPTEAPFFAWLGVYHRAGIPVRSLNLTRLACMDASFDCVVSLSVIEHAGDVERSLSEMHRVLVPGGRMLVTTDCSPEPTPSLNGSRHFSESELERLFAPYNVTSPRNRPDFSRENWCYGLGRPVVTAFVEIRKPR
jgi:SAM-dependent methyltransferase